MILDYEKLSRIKNALRFKPKGMNISEISRHLKINRNSVAKYLEILIISGEVETHPYGTSKIYALSQLVPVSAMLRFSSDMILMIAHDGRIIQANDQFLVLANTSRESIVGTDYAKTGISLFSDLPIQEFLDDESGKKTEIFEKTIETAGKELYLRIKFVRTLYEDGKNGLTIIIDDISDRILAELALAERENLYDSILKNIQDVFYRSDLQGNLILASPNWATILGYNSLDECIGRNIADVFYLNPEKRTAFVEAVFKNGSVHDYDVILKKKDGTPLYVATNSHLIQTESGEIIGIEGVFRDISERQLAAEKIRKYLSLIEFLSLKLREFIVLPYHENIYEKIGNDISGLIPDALIVVNSYDPLSAIVTVRSVMPIKDLRVCEQIMGRDILGLELPISPIALNNLRSGILHKINISLHEAAFEALPRDQCEQIEQALNLAESFTIGFADGGALFGNVSIFLHKNAAIPDPSLILAYTRQAAIALQRRSAEDALKKSEELFYQVAQQLPFPLAIIDKSGKFRFINLSFTKLFGYDLSDFQTGREWFIMAFPDTQYRKNAVDLWKSDLALFSEQGTVPREFFIQCKDGTIKEVLFRMMYFSTKEKCIICQDMTEIRKTEHMQKLLSSIVESTDDAIIGKDPEGVILSWNRAAEMMYGYPANEIIGKSITCIIPHDKYAEYKKIIDQIRNGQGVSNLETQRICKDRSLVDVSLTISPIFDEHGILSGISTISRNISSRKAEQRLLQSEEKYRALVENMNVGVYRSTGDPRGKFVWGNPSLVEILGYSSFDQLEKIRVSEIFVENNGRKKHLDELNRTGFVKNKELSLKRADGSVIWVSVTALAQFNPDGKIEFINGIVEDITAMKQISQEMGDLRKEFFEVIHYFPDAVVIIDAQKKVIAWNPALEKLTGVLQENILGKTGYAGALPFFDSHHPVLMDLIDEPDDKIRTHYPNVILKDRSLVAEFFVSSMNNGTGAYLWTKAAPLMDREGHRLGAVEFIRDITERKKIDACLKRTIISPRGRDTEETGINRALSDGLPLLSGTHSLVYSFYLSQALKNNPDYLTILDNAGKCLWANDAFLSLMHEKGGDFHPGNNLVYYVAPEFRKKILTCLSDVRKDGHKSLPIMFFIGTRRIPVDVTISVIHDFNNDILGFLAIARRETGSG